MKPFLDAISLSLVLFVVAFFCITLFRLQFYLKTIFKWYYGWNFFFYFSLSLVIYFKVAMEMNTVTDWCDFFFIFEKYKYGRSVCVFYFVKSFIIISFKIGIDVLLLLNTDYSQLFSTNISHFFHLFDIIFVCVNFIATKATRKKKNETFQRKYWKSSWNFVKVYNICNDVFLISKWHIVNMFQNSKSLELTRLFLFHSSVQLNMSKQHEMRYWFDQLVNSWIERKYASHMRSIV